MRAFQSDSPVKRAHTQGCSLTTAGVLLRHWSRFPKHETLLHKTGGRLVFALFSSPVWSLQDSHPCSGILNFIHWGFNEYWFTKNSSSANLGFCFGSIIPQRTVSSAQDWACRSEKTLEVPIWFLVGEAPGTSEGASNVPLRSSTYIWNSSKVPSSL